METNISKKQIPKVVPTCFMFGSVFYFKYIAKTTEFHYSCELQYCATVSSALLALEGLT